MQAQVQTNKGNEIRKNTHQLLFYKLALSIHQLALLLGLG
jgi:hypothetical protein